MFAKGQNPNHPKKDSIIAADPLISFDEIREVKEYLATHATSPEGVRNLSLFSLGINVAFRASDLLKLKVSQVKDLKPGDNLVTREKKTRKVRPVTLNNTAFQAIQPLLDAPDDAPLFRSQRGGPLTVGTLGNKVKEWCAKCGLKGSYSSHTLRKTFGRMQVVHFGVPVYVLTEIFQHSSPAVTMRYLGLQPDDISRAYQNEL